MYELVTVLERHQLPCHLDGVVATVNFLPD